jgi:predicted DNA binding protein
MRKHLEYLEKHARGRYKVVSLTDARFSPNSPIARLTEKQRRVLITAYKLGYYDLPRRIGSEELARKLNLVKSTFVAHRRKAERRLLTEMLSEL